MAFNIATLSTSDDAMVLSSKKQHCDNQTYFRSVSSEFSFSLVSICAQIGHVDNKCNNITIKKLFKKSYKSHILLNNRHGHLAIKKMSIWHFFLLPVTVFLWKDLRWQPCFISEIYGIGRFNFWPTFFSLKIMKLSFLGQNTVYNITTKVYSKAYRSAKLSQIKMTELENKWYGVLSFEKQVIWSFVLQSRKKQRRKNAEVNHFCQIWKGFCLNKKHYSII